jgi:tyrosyl-tRNA synthetase
MKTITEGSRIRNLLARGTEEVFVREHLEARLAKGDRLRVKLGIDPTGPTLHLGRAITLRKLKAFQDMGHQAVLVVGDFTALIGDPSDKLKKRPMLTHEEIETNMKGYKKILGKIIDTDKAEIVYNSSWLAGLTFREIAELAESFSVQQMLARRNFKDRFEKGDEISLREFLYPLMQGYDSVAIRADVELGGFDQLFNLKAGRVVQKYYGQPEQDVLITKMLLGTDGRKMSTSWGNVINITDEPNDMFGKVMSLKDELIRDYFSLCTELVEEEIEEIFKTHENPRDRKMLLGSELVKLYYSKKEAEKARDSFIEAFQKKGLPSDVEEVKVTRGTLLAEVLLSAGAVSSKTEFRRLVDASAVRVHEGDAIQDYDAVVTTPMTLKVGKRRFLKITIE